MTVRVFILLEFLWSYLWLEKLLSDLGLFTSFLLDNRRFLALGILTFLLSSWIFFFDFLLNFFRSLTIRDKVFYFHFQSSLNDLLFSLWFSKVFRERNRIYLCYEYCIGCDKRTMALIIRIDHRYLC